MPFVHNLNRRIQGQTVSSRLYTAKTQALGHQLDIPRYRQQDTHSCGFLSVLAVVRYFFSQIQVEKVLEVVKPNADGCNQTLLIQHLKKFGIKATYREGLGVREICRSIEKGEPIIVTVEPDWYLCDHWTVIRGLEPINRWVYLTNYEDEIMEWAEFQKIWSPAGGGLICSYKNG